MAFNRSVASQAVALLYPKAFYKIWHASLFLQSRTLTQFLVGYLVMLFHFSVNESFELRKELYRQNHCLCR